MTTPKGMQSIGAHLLPHFSTDSISNAEGQTRVDANVSTGDRFILSNEDLNDPDKRALFTSEARRHLPWLHEKSESWENDDKQDDVALHASRELATSIDNWAKAAVDSAIVMSTLTDMAQDPAISTAMLPAMKGMAEAHNREVYSLLLTFAAQGAKDSLGKAGTLILANRLGVDHERGWWMNQLGLVLAVRHFEHFEPVRVTSTMEMLTDPDTNPIPFSIVQDLASKFDDLKGMEETVHEALREAHVYFEYLYNSGESVLEKDRFKTILGTLSSTDLERMDPFSEEDFRFLAYNLKLPGDAMLMSIAYHAQVNPSYYEVLEAFADRSAWGMPADEILQVIEDMD